MRAILLLCVRKNINIIFSGAHRKYASSPFGKLSTLLSPRCDAHMNELPVPTGPWGPWYKKKQRFYTSWLIAGIVWWVFSLLMAINSGCFYFNWGPPLQPSPPSDMIDDCD